MFIYTGFDWCGSIKAFIIFVRLAIGGAIQLPGAAVISSKLWFSAIEPPLVMKSRDSGALIIHVH